MAFMKTFEAIESRRSVKHYDPEHQITEEELNQLLSLAILSPTSFNLQNWRFVVVTDPEIRGQLREAAWNQAQVTEASIVVLLCGDLKAAEKDPGRYWKDAPAAARDVLVPMITPFYQDNPQLQRDEVMRSCGIAGQTLMLAARAMGYDSCPMVGFDFNRVAGIIGLPEDHIIAFMLTIGKALKPAWPRPGQLPLSEVVVRDRFA